jgi:hypothetical protein
LGGNAGNPPSGFAGVSGQASKRAPSGLVTMFVQVTVNSRHVLRRQFRLTENAGFSSAFPPLSPQTV